MPDEHAGPHLPESARWREIIGRLGAAGVAFEPGLTDAEAARAESEFHFRFPPDLLAFLRAALPAGEHFPDSRDGNPAVLRRWLASPLEGILFDIGQNGFWLPEWGPAPGSSGEAECVAAERIAQVPRLIPVYRHRMMPDDPHEAGNPVFSVHQTDVIVYGVDLEDYWCAEFRIAPSRPAPSPARKDPLLGRRAVSGGAVGEKSGRLRQPRGSGDAARRSARGVATIRGFCPFQTSASWLK